MIDKYNELDYNTIISLQKMCQKLREYINVIAKNDDMRKELYIDLSTQFLLYGLAKSNERFIKASFEDVLDILAIQAESVISSVCGVEKEEKE